MLLSHKKVLLINNISYIGKIMEKNLKIQLEKYLDMYNDKNNLQTNITLLKPLQNKGVIECLKSALIGKIYGGAMGFFITMNLQREITPKIVDEFNDVFLQKIKPVEKLIDNIIV
jgi:hypothetical protein